MTRVWLLALIFGPSVSSAQMAGTFSLEKTVFAPGEPVFLSFDLRNVGKEKNEVQTGDLYSFCSGYRIEIVRDGVPASKCSQGYAGSCLGGAISLAPGATHTDRILLNYPNQFHLEKMEPVKVAGDYTIDAIREVSFAPEGSGARLFEAPSRSEVHQVLHLRVDDAVELAPSAYAPFVQQLEAKDPEIRRKAARTLATVAPLALEPLLLTFALSKDPFLSQFAPLALANLKTTASLAALAKMLVKNEPGSYEYSMAAEYLGQTHDPAWMPLLLEAADQHGGMYLTNAAESGGDKAVPALLTKLRSADLLVRGSAIVALGHTGSRSAVPPLMGLLAVKRTADEAEGNDVAIAARSALMKLTHRYAEQGLEGNGFLEWQRWWFTSGSTASIYGPGECGEYTKLP